MNEDLRIAKKRSALTEFLTFRFAFISISLTIIAFLLFIVLPLVNFEAPPVYKDFILDDIKLSEYQNGSDLINDLNESVERDLTSVYGEVSSSNIDEGNLLK